MADNNENATRQITHQIAGRLQAEQDRGIAHVIEATPTGDRRNLLTEAQIHLAAAIDKLKEAAK